MGRTSRMNSAFRVPTIRFYCAHMFRFDLFESYRHFRPPITCERLCAQEELKITTLYSKTAFNCLAIDSSFNRRLLGKRSVQCLASTALNSPRSYIKRMAAIFRIEQSTVCLEEKVVWPPADNSAPLRVSYYKQEYLAANSAICCTY